MTFLALFLTLAQPEVIPAPVPAPIAVPAYDTIYGPVGGTTALPAETVTVASPVRVANVSGATLRGDGPRSAIVYDGPDGGACLELTGTQRATLENVWLRARLDFAKKQPVAEAGIVLTKRPGDAYAQTAARFRDVTFGSQNGLADFRTCVLIDSRKYGQPDGNNDLHTFDRVRFRGYRDAAVHVVAGSTQVHALKFRDCDMEGDGRAKYGIRWDAKPYFVWQGGSGGHHTACDFWIGDVGAKVEIRGWNSEHTERLLDTAGPTGAYGPMTVSDCRVDSVRARDGAVIRGKRPGPWTVTGNYFAVGPGNASELCIDLSNLHVPAAVTVTGNTFVHGRRPVGPLVKAPRGSKVIVSGNVHVYPGGITYID